jgi:flagellar motor protein MotB
MLNGNRLLTWIFSSYWGAAIAVLIFSVVFWAIDVVIGGWSWIVPLFAFPLVVQLVGLRTLSKRLVEVENKDKFSKLIFYWFYLVTMIFCVIFYCLLWYCYLRLSERFHWEDNGRWLDGYNLMGQGSWMGVSWVGWVTFLSGVAFVFIVALLLAVVRMTEAIIKGAPPVIKDTPKELRWEDLKSLDCLRCGAAQEPFLTLLFFFTVFLSISYLFGLAFAFHDKSNPPGRPALYMKNLPEPEGLFHANDLRNPADLARRLKNPAEDNQTGRVSEYLKQQLLPDTKQLLDEYDGGTPTEDLQRGLVKELDRAVRDVRLYDPERFPPGTLDDETRRLVEKHPKTEEELHKLNRSLLEQAYQKEKTIARSRSGPFPLKFATSAALLVTDERQEQGPEKLGAEAIKENGSKLEELLGEVRNATDESRRARIVVTGYADDANPKAAAYKSNYELAEARALDVRSTILNRLSPNGYDKWRNIEWVLLPKPSERKDGKRFAEVYLERVPEEAASLLVPYLKAEHANPLHLLDYVYFANYTITTTGYGDIIPSTGYAKFVCSFANICEVFFLVVFFNALLSLRKGGDRLQEGEALILRELSELRGLLSAAGGGPQQPPSDSPPDTAERDLDSSEESDGKLPSRRPDLRA